MLIFFESGRLGNQLFQYVAMRRFQPDGLIVAVGMKELRDVFEGVDLVGASRIGALVNCFVKVIGKEAVDKTARHWRLFSFVEEARTVKGTEFRYCPGFFRNLVYFEAGYYQSENMINATASNQLKIKAGIENEARRFLAELPASRKDLYFVHVRRGDYVRWPSPAAAAVLPKTWYLEQMDRIRSHSPRAYFVIVTDDRPYAEYVFSGVGAVLVSHQRPELDFGIMAGCQGGGVLSASSFSWWAAYFGRRENPRARFVAPLYWAGFRRRSWYPLGVQTSWLEYREVQLEGLVRG